MIHVILLAVMGRAFALGGGACPPGRASVPLPALCRPLPLTLPAPPFAQSFMLALAKHLSSLSSLNHACIRICVPVLLPVLVGVADVSPAAVRAPVPGAAVPVPAGRAHGGVPVPLPLLVSLHQPDGLLGAAGRVHMGRAR